MSGLNTGYSRPDDTSEASDQRHLARRPRMRYVTCLLTLPVVHSVQPFLIRFRGTDLHKAIKKPPQERLGMDILIQPLLDKARRLNASLHIRYSARSRPPGEATDSGGEDPSSQSIGGRATMTSYVIIRREYSYLEPLIRSMFQEAADVRVLIDRRSEERRDPPTALTEGEGRSSTDRRASSPMLDILINVES